MPQILIAEDDPDMRLLLREALAESHPDLCAQFVCDGQALLDVLGCGETREGCRPPQAERPGLVLTDLDMPRTDGAEAVSAIRADPALRDLPVVVLTGSTDLDASLRVQRAGADECLTKPGTFRELVELVGNVVRDRYAQ